MLTDNNSFVSVFHTLPSAPYILDEHNRARIFHGTNFVVKNEPWYPASLLNETHVATLASMGMNTVRLGYMWSGAQPVPGTFNQTYIDIMDQIITLLNKYEIYPFLDVHQDVMSSYFCLYDAFPSWVVDQSDKSQHAFPWPLKSDPVTGDPCPADRGWGSNYVSEACGTAFQSLYTAGSPMEQAFMSYWEMIATHHKTKAILGYELINEPWAGNIYSDPTLLLPGHAGSRNLGPFYDRVAEKIRSVDSTHLLFYEPVTWGMIFNGTVLGSGFEHVPGGPDHADQAVFSFHYYCWWYSDLNNDFQRQSCDQVFAPKVFRQVDKETKRLGGAAMLTEWGQACAFDTADPLDATSECAAVMDLADQHLFSWTDWYFGEALTAGGDAQRGFDTLTSNARSIFSRTYAPIIAGTPFHMHFDVTTSLFDLCFLQPSSATAKSSAASSDELKTAGKEGSHVLHDINENTSSAVEGFDGGSNKDVPVDMVAEEADLTVLYVPFALRYPLGATINILTPHNLVLHNIDTNNNRVVLRNRRVNNPHLPTAASTTTAAVESDRQRACVQITPKAE